MAKAAKVSKLKAVILASGRKQLWIAGKTGIHVSTMSLIVNDRRKPTPKQKASIARALRKNPAELF